MSEQAKKILAYDIITDYFLDSLIERVNARIESGHWEPIGGIFAFNGPDAVIFYQAMVRIKE